MDVLKSEKVMGMFLKTECLNIIIIKGYERLNQKQIIIEIPLYK